MYYVFSGDDTFVIEKHIKPYTGVYEKDNIKQIFNYLL